MSQFGNPHRFLLRMLFGLPAGDYHRSHLLTFTCSWDIPGRKAVLGTVLPSEVRLMSALLMWYSQGMESAWKMQLIRQIAVDNARSTGCQLISWSRHAIAELLNEGWNRIDVESGIESSELIEDYPETHRPLPDCLVLGRLPGGEPFHAVLAVDVRAGRLFIITVYKPSTEAWENDWKRRKP
jgi:hypothetical protein